MPRIAWILIVAGGLILPIVSIAYLRLRIAARRTQLRNLFTLPGIVERYLTARGRNPGQLPGESPEDRSRRLQAQFDRVFSSEFEQEYSVRSFWVSILVASAATAGVIWFLVAEAFGS